MWSADDERYFCFLIDRCISNGFKEWIDLIRICIQGRQHLVNLADAFHLVFYSFHAGLETFHADGLNQGCKSDISIILAKKNPVLSARSKHSIWLKCAFVDKIINQHTDVRF